MKTKYAKLATTLTITVFLFSVLFLTNTSTVHSRDFITPDDIDAFVMSADDDEADLAICLVTTVIDAFTDLSLCGDDPTCTNTVMVSMVLDMVLCVNPDNDNVALTACVTDITQELLLLSEVCDGDQLCLVLNATPLMRELVDCLEE